MPPGYMIVPTGRVPKKYDGGFSIYTAAWSLLFRYPGRQFQSGLFGTGWRPNMPVEDRSIFILTLKVAWGGGVVRAFPLLHRNFTLAG